MKLQGSCHCGAVQFRFEIEEPIVAHRCNCSICASTGFLHLIVENGAFELESGENELTEYRFNTGTARHLFCRHCGVKSFYVPRSHPDGYSVNARCVSWPGQVGYRIEEFDGRNWEQSIESRSGQPW